MFLITLCLVSLVEFSTVGNGNRTILLHTPSCQGQRALSGFGTSGHFTLSWRALPWIQVCSLQLREVQWHSLAAQWVPLHSLGCADSSWDCFYRMAALLSYDSTCPTSFHAGMLAQDQHWQLSILQKKTPIYPLPAFHLNSNQLYYIDTVRCDWISDVVWV